MASHNHSIFKNLCLKVPRKPNSNQPLPMYEQKIINELENQARKLSLDSDKSSPDCDKQSIKSFIKFYDSIPDYGDINHLSNKDFYRRLENLKQRQRAFYDHISSEAKFGTKSTDWVDDYKSLNSIREPKKSSLKPFCITPNKSPCVDFKRAEDLDSILSEDVKDVVQPPSRRSVRIESPKFSDLGEGTPDVIYFRSKSRAGSKSIGSCNDSILDDLTPEDLKILNSEREFDTLITRSVPNSPVKTKQNVGWKDGGITIPKPFQMTVRDEENKIVEDILIKTIKPPKEDKYEMFRAHPIPVESQIPLYDKIVADSEKRSRKVKKKRKAALQAQMKPFSFTRRDEEIQEITKRLSKSSPSLFLDDIPVKVKRFKAKPVPKNLFSNYIYKKMYEDEYYRALQKKIRAEEMLKASTLPPSMAKRDQLCQKYGEICPRSFRDLDITDIGGDKFNCKNSQQKLLEKEFDQLQFNFIGGSPYESSKKKKGKRKKPSTRSNSTQPTPITSAESVNRSNLAAVLRIQSARRRMEDEISRKLEASRIREEARWRERVIRQRPGWQSLAYSHEEDLAMRLQLRRDEERLRREEHHLRMRTMIGRVNQQPFLFERSFQQQLRGGGDCKTREELITRLYGSAGSKGGSGGAVAVAYGSSDGLATSLDSNSVQAQDMRSCHLAREDLTDDGLQAQFEEMFATEEIRAVHGDTDDEKPN